MDMNQIITQIITQYQPKSVTQSSCMHISI